MTEEIKVICAVGCSFFKGAIEGENPLRTRFLSEYASYYSRAETTGWLGDKDWVDTKLEDKDWVDTKLEDKDWLDNNTFKHINWREKSFINLLAAKFGAKPVNLSATGAGNDYIFRTAYNWIKSSGDLYSGKKAAVIVGLSELMRTERYDEEGGIWYHFSYSDLVYNGTTNDNVEFFRKSTFPYLSKEEWETYWDISAKHFSNISILKDEVKMKMDLISSYCRVNNIKCIFINNLCDVIAYSKAISSNLTNLFGGGVKYGGDLIHSDMYIFPNGSSSWRQWLTEKDSSYRGEHPNSYDHKGLAELLYHHIIQ